MDNYCTYVKLKQIPDLSLNKYQSLSSSGVDGILEKHSSFLRQWHRVAMLGDISLHLLISYEPTRPKSQKLEIGFLLNYTKDNLKYIEKAIKVLNASPLSEFYELSNSEFIKNCNNEKNFICAPDKSSFKILSMLYKKERFLVPVSQESNPQFFYVVPKWEMEEKARLYNMIKLMQSLDESCLYRVDLYPKELSEEMHENFSKPLSWLRMRCANINNSISLTEKQQKFISDPSAEETLKQYEEWLKALDTSPTFYADVSIFANEENTSQILLDAAASECIKSGYHSIRTKHGNFNTLSFIDKKVDEPYSDKAPEILKMWPTTFTLEDISPFFRFPALYDGEFIELPKETSPKYVLDGLYIGKDSNGYDVNIDIDKFAKHMFVCGVPGSGKTNTMLHLASDLWKKHNIPFLVFEPAKQEYRSLALPSFGIPELIVFSPSSNTKFPMALNPFEFPIGLTLSEHISRLVEVFEGSFLLFPPMPFLLDKAIENIYINNNWELSDINKGDKIYPTISQLYNQLEKELDSTDYEGEIKGNLRSALEMRIGSLLRREKADIFDTKVSTIRPEDWLKKPIIIELESLGEGPANFITLLLCTLIRETLKVEKINESKFPNAFNNQEKVKHIIFIEEAHNLIAPTTQSETGENTNPKIAATAFIVKMLAEVRALKEGIIIADQLPTAMAPEIIKNTNIKLLHRLTSAEDRALIGGAMSANELQLENVATYSQGRGLFNYEGMMRPFELQVHYQKEHDVLPPEDIVLFSILKNNAVYSKVMRDYSDRMLSTVAYDIEGFANLVFTTIKNFINNLPKYDIKEFKGKMEVLSKFKNEILKEKNKYDMIINKIALNNKFCDKKKIETYLSDLMELENIVIDTYMKFESRINANA